MGFNPKKMMFLISVFSYASCVSPKKEINGVPLVSSEEAVELLERLEGNTELEVTLIDQKSGEAKVIIMESD